MTASAPRRALYPLFLDLDGRPVVVVGAGPVGAQKALALLQAGARVTVVAPTAAPAIAAAANSGQLRWERRAFAEEDLAGAFLAVAATSDAAVNAAVRRAGDARGLFVNAVDDVRSASAYGAALLRRGPVTIALSSGGRAPALCRLLREALDRLLPPEEELERWARRSDALRPAWRAGVPIGDRFLQLLRAVLAEAEAS